MRIFLKQKATTIIIYIDSHYDAKHNKYDMSKSNIISNVPREISDEKLSYAGYNCVAHTYV